MKLIPIARVEGDMLGEIIKGRLVAEGITCEITAFRSSVGSKNGAPNTSRVSEIYVVEDRKDGAIQIIKEIDPIAVIY